MFSERIEGPHKLRKCLNGPEMVIVEPFTQLLQVNVSPKADKSDFDETPMGKPDMERNVRSRMANALHAGPSHVSALA